MRKPIGILLVTVVVVAIVLAGWTLSTLPQRERLIISTTTSLYETGLLDLLGREFEAKHPVLNVSFISQGTGLAIQTAARGDADLILVHDPAREKTFLDDGYGINRKIVAYNYFIVVGPDEDPAGIGGLSPIDALLAIKAAGDKGEASWISRGDDSGTHSREKNLWKAGGEDPAELRDLEWYLEAGLGMTATLNLADEKRGYTLCDLGSFLKNRVAGNIHLKILVEAGKDTLNVYSAIACDPRNADLKHVKFSQAMKFIEFLVSEEVQEILADFGIDEFRQPLFNPAVEILETSIDPTTASWIKELAFIDGSECPLHNRYEAGDLPFSSGSIAQCVPRREILS